MRRDYIIFKGIHSRAMGVRMTKMPKDTRPPIRKKIYTVPGRHGTLKATEADHQVYDTYTETMECVLLPHANPDEVKEWLSGDGDLVTSIQPDRKQAISIEDTMQAEIIARGYLHRRMRISATFQPLKYEKEASRLKLYQADWVQNPGNVESEPVITVYGTGDFTLYINGEAILLTGINESITLDAPMGDAYNDRGLQNGKMLGEFPVFLPGKNTISWDGRLLWLDIQPNWRWV